MKINIKHPDIPVISDHVGYMADALPVEVAGTLNIMGSKIQAEQVARTPVDTGVLAANNNYQLTWTLSRIELEIFNDTRYAKFQEFGTGRKGAENAPAYMPPGLIWKYGAQITGHAPQSFFYAPILANRDWITKALEDKLERLGEYARVENEG